MGPSLISDALCVWYMFQLLGRTLRVDHVEEYRKPKEHGDEDEMTLKIRSEGIAPKAAEPVTTRAPEPDVRVKKKEKTGT